MTKETKFKPVRLDAKAIRKLRERNDMTVKDFKKMIGDKK